MSAGATPGWIASAQPGTWTHFFSALNGYFDWELDFFKSNLLPTSGYAAVWAAENIREVIFDAMKRRETYATQDPGCLSGSLAAGILRRKMPTPVSREKRLVSTHIVRGIFFSRDLMERESVETLNGHILQVELMN